MPVKSTEYSDADAGRERDRLSYNGSPSETESTETKMLATQFTTSFHVFTLLNERRYTRKVYVRETVNEKQMENVSKASLKWSKWSK